MFINDNSQVKKLKNNILTLSVEAQRAKKLDKNVINATSGMLADEDGNLYEFSSVKNALKNLNTKEKYGYADTGGTKEFKESIAKWLFGNNLDQIKENHYLECIPTPGGSGALSLIFANYVSNGETVLLPNHMWENYLTYAKELNFKTDTYNLFNNLGKFDIDSIKLKTALLKQNQKRVLIVLNDPCQNPTGFCMTDSDYDSLIELANNNPLTDFIFVMDVAYFDFYNKNSNLIRNRYAKLKDLPENALALFCFSGSKSFGLYGLRIGALLIMAKDENEAKTFIQASCYSSRARWSSATTLGMNLISKIISNDEYVLSFKEEVKKVCKMLENRSLAFLSSAKKVGLNTLPYEKGFFICIPCKDPEHMMHALHQDKVHLVVTKNCLRVALCAISEKEALVLPKIIKGRLSLEE